MYCAPIIQENVEYLRSGGVMLVPEAERREQRLRGAACSGKTPTDHHWYMRATRPAGFTNDDKDMNLTWMGMEEVRDFVLQKILCPKSQIQH